MKTRCYLFFKISSVKAGYYYYCIIIHFLHMNKMKVTKPSDLPKIPQYLSGRAGTEISELLLIYRLCSSSPLQLAMPG